MKTYKNNVIKSFGLKGNLTYKLYCVDKPSSSQNENSSTCSSYFVGRLSAMNLARKKYLDNNNNNGDGKITRNN